MESSGFFLGESPPIEPEVRLQRELDKLAEIDPDLVPMHRQYWSQILRVAPWVNLVVVNPKENFEQYVRTEFSVVEALEFAKSKILNYEELHESYSALFETLELEVDDEIITGLHNFWDELELLAFASNHQNYFDTVIPNIFMASFMFEKLGIDIRHQQTIPTSVKALSHAHPTPDGGQLHYSLQMRLFGNNFLMTPPTETGQLADDDPCKEIIDRQTMAKVRALLSGEAEKVMSMSVIGAQDRSSGQWNQEPTDGTCRLIIPHSQRQLLVPVAHASRGSSGDFLRGLPIRVGVAIGNPIRFNQKLKTFERVNLGREAIEHIYDDLVPQAEAMLHGPEKRAYY